MRQAAKYKRISRDREGLALGIERQDEDLEKLASQLGLTVVADYWDNDISASTRSRKPRPGYTKLLESARAGHFDVILAYTTSRLTRRPREHEDLIDLATNYGIEFQYVRSPSFDLNTAQGRRIARTLAAHDAGEAEEAQERIVRQKQQAAAKGEWRGGRRPYGYDSDGMTVRPDEAKVIRDAMSHILSHGSLRTLVADMNARGLRTSADMPWRTTTLRRVLTRARNAGFVETRRPEGGMEIVGKAAWEPIMSEEEWRAICAYLTDPTRRTNSTNTARRWLGSGLYLCGVCGDGSTVQGGMVGRRENFTPVYYCASGVKHLVRRADMTDAYVADAVIGWLSRPAMAGVLTRRELVDVAAVKTELAGLRAKLEEVDDMLLTDELDRARHRRLTAPVRARIDELNAALVAASEVSPLAGIVGEVDVQRRWEAADVQRRQAIVESVCRVTLRPGRKGRPPNWREGQPYFDPSSIDLEWL